MTATKPRITDCAECGGQGCRRCWPALEAVIEVTERAALPCVMCDEIGEPHVCERAWWRQQLAHGQSAECADPECLCHEAARLDAEADLLRSLLPGVIA